MGKRHLNVLSSHSCSNVKMVDLLCIDENGEGQNFSNARMLFSTVGVEHSIQIKSCGCEPLSSTLIRAHLWPATPQFPKRVFTFKLLDWMEALMLECQVALKDFCQALYFMCQYSHVKVSDKLLPSYIYLFT